MRLFHHFLVAAHPCFPPENEGVWVRDIPTLSHQYEYLMHSILALAGSHLDSLVEDPEGHSALVHRQKAITGLEKAFTRWPPQAHEAHAMLATSYLLAHQSSFMVDGFLDNILSLRGCALISQMIHSHRLKGAFTIIPDMDTAFLEWKPNNFPAFDRHLARDALCSMANFAPHLTLPSAHDIERALVAQLVECLAPLLLPLEKSGTSGSSTLALMNTVAKTTVIGRNGACFFASSSPESLLENVLHLPTLPVQFIHTTSWDTITEVSPDHKSESQRSFNALMSIHSILHNWHQKQSYICFRRPTR